MTWGIWTSISHGVTGSRSGWLRDAEDKPLRFDRRDEAEAEAERLTAGRVVTGGTTPSGRPIAYQYYRAAEVIGE